MPDQTMLVVKRGTKPGPFEEAKKTASPQMTGEGDVNHLCGVCGFTVLRHLKPGQVSGIAFVCPVCGSTNGVPPA
jgi:hypothetical protein